MPTSFTRKEDNFLRRNYLTMPTKAMADALGRSGFGTKYRMKSLGLIVPPEVSKRFAIESRFKKGHASHNKGIPMPKSVRRKVRHVWFKKGNLPHNTRKDGDISIRTDSKGKTYKHIRTSLGKWELLHRVLWREKRGPIPPGMILTFKNGNSLDVRLANLKLISREQHAINNRNKFMEALSPEMKQAFHALRGFNRKLNKYVKDNQ